MGDPLLIYGATGYTGRLIVDAAKARGLRPLLAGRSESKLAALAERTGLEYRVVRLTDGAALDRVLNEVSVVLHAAGPFSETARPMVDACLRTRTHYLDITGEVAVIDGLSHRDGDGRRRGVMIMPGVGFDVVPSDCLGAHVARRLPNAQRLIFGLRGLQFVTRASAKTLIEHAIIGVNIRRDGMITSVVPGASQRTFDYGAGPALSFAVSWGDVASAYYTTGIPNIEVYFASLPSLQAMLTATRYFGRLLGSGPLQAWFKAHADMLPEGPTPEERAGAQIVIVAEAEDRHGRRASARMVTPEAYACTATLAPAIAHRVLQGDFEPGFQTPGRVYGPDFALSFPGISRVDIG
ncbi:MAG TPA: saccharopine dehydrogenase NADP-binding domain-containing protein [Candidatus Binatia bacterium]|nr:saccharopine dehydrogenase NADP-binding domain-containing protein [Candidatus Binatia bacterium]